MIRASRPVVILFMLCTFLSSGAVERVLTASDTTGYFPPTIANGHTGLVIDVTGLKPVKAFQASVFDDGTAGHVSTIRPAIVPVSLNVSDSSGDTLISDWTQRLDMTEAAATTSFRRGDLRISSTIRALRQMPHAVMMELTVTALRNTTVRVANVPSVPESMTDVVVGPANIWCDDGGMRLVRADAVYNSGRSTVSVASMLVPIGKDWRLDTDDNSLSVSLRGGQSASLWAIAAECSSADFADPANEADRQVIYAVRQGRQNLVDEHLRRWNDLWESRIEIEGDDNLQTQVNSALYNLYNSIREGSRRSIAPMGLTSDKYYGHIFWDADTWILPVLAVLHPELARSMVDYRVDGLPAARRRASAYGYRGAMYPWESDHRGEESTPTFALTGPLEHHITADVARGAWLYFCVTADTAWLASDGYPLLRECADFWVDRMSEAPDGGSGRWTVRNVVGADEYAIGVDGDAFTNGAARRALEYADAAARIIGVRPDPRWSGIASSVDFRTFPDSKVFREHLTYNNEMTKQADVELLAFPLGLMTDPDTIRANIEHYAGLIDSIGGPAMSHSAMAVNYARMGEPDRAARLIDRAYRPNLRGSFNSISETPGNDETYFMTGAGGLLQAVIFGYAGLEITPGGITTLPHSRPSSIRRLRVVTPSAVFE